MEAWPRSIASGEFKTLVALFDDVSEFLAVARGAAVVDDVLILCCTLSPSFSPTASSTNIM